MGATDYLFSFKGRVNRARMWFFYLVAIAWDVAAFVVVCIVFGLMGISFASDEASLADFSQSASGSFLTVILALMGATYLYAFIAVSVKRLHDRQKGGAWLIVFFALPVALEIAGFIVAGGLEPLIRDYTALPTAIGLGLIAAAIVIGIWGFAELHCLRGTEGDNRFGQDPLA